MAMWPWSWYIASTASNSPPMARLNTESAGSGPLASIPEFRAAATAGAISSSSSRPSNPPSPPWGLSAATAMRALGRPQRVSESLARRSLASTLAQVTKRAASARDLWVERCTTRSPGVISMVAVVSAPVSRARISWWPMSST